MIYPNFSQIEDPEPTFKILMPFLAAHPHLLSLSGGWSPGWRSNNPTCGYPAVHGYLGEEVNICFIGGPLF